MKDSTSPGVWGKGSSYFPTWEMHFLLISVICELTGIIRILDLPAYGGRILLYFLPFGSALAKQFIAFFSYWQYVAVIFLSLISGDI